MLHEEARRPKVTEGINLSLDLRILALKPDVAFLQRMYVNFTFLSPFIYQVVFRGGEGALQVLPPLVDVIPEARLNLVSTCSNSLQKYILTSNQLKCWKIPS